MGTQFGHSGGINIANYRLLADNGKRNATKTHYRSPLDWARESKAHMGLGGSHQQLSANLRHASNTLQQAAAEQEASDIQSVEDALRAKIAHTEALKQALEAAVQDVSSEFEACVTLRGNLEERREKVHGKLEVNRGRLQIRDTRPAREKTMDDAEKMLLDQQTLIGTFVEKVTRSIAHLDREMGQLDGCRAKLNADLRDKAAAMDLDQCALAVPADGVVEEGEQRRRQSGASLKTPLAWVKSSTDNLNAARALMIESARLRKAIRHIIHNTRQAEHEVARMLNTSLLAKLGGSTHLRETLDQQLDEVRQEHAKAEQQRRRLAAALEAKRGPLQQAKERFAMRKARPDREMVEDDVQRALAREIAHLHAVTAQITYKSASIEREMENLEITAATIQDNLADKAAAGSADKRTLLLDGRSELNVPPPSSIFTASSQASLAKSQTLRRISALEAELTSARNDRENLEQSIRSLRGALLGDSRPATPGGR